MKPIRHCWCGSMVEGNTEQCATHNAEDRKNERAAMKQKVVRQVMKVTPKRAKQNVEYLKLRKDFLEANPCCGVEGCYLKSVDVHHKEGRENDKLTDVTKWLPICRKHHDHYTEHSKQAKEDGVSVNRIAKTE